MRFTTVPVSGGNKWCASVGMSIVIGNFKGQGIIELWSILRKG